jgi:transcriptional regulator with XRE-family HTH domain
MRNTNFSHNKSKKDCVIAMKLQITINLKKIRKERGLTLQELEKISNVTNSDISKVERGVVSPTLETLRLIAEALDLKVCDLFDEHQAE